MTDKPLQKLKDLVPIKPDINSTSFEISRLEAEITALKTALAVSQEALKRKEYDQHIDSGDGESPDEWCSDCGEYSGEPHKEKCLTGKALSPEIAKKALEELEALKASKDCEHCTESEIEEGGEPQPATICESCYDAEKIAVKFFKNQCNIKEKMIIELEAKLRLIEDTSLHALQFEQYKKRIAELENVVALNKADYEAHHAEHHKRQASLERKIAELEGGLK